MYFITEIISNSTYMREIQIYHTIDWAADITAGDASERDERAQRSAESNHRWPRLTLHRSEGPCGRAPRKIWLWFRNVGHTLKAWPETNEICRSLPGCDYAVWRTDGVGTDSGAGVEQTLWCNILPFHQRCNKRFVTIRNVVISYRHTITTTLLYVSAMTVKLDNVTLFVWQTFLPIGIIRKHYGDRYHIAIHNRPTDYTTKGLGEITSRHKLLRWPLSSGKHCKRLNC